MANDKAPVCAVVGVGPGNGEAFARRFSADGYAVALLARGARTDLAPRGRAAARESLCLRRRPTRPRSQRRSRKSARSSATSTSSFSTPARASGARSRRSRRRISSGRGGSTRSASSSPRGRRSRRCAGAGSGAIIVVGATASRRGVAGTAAFAPAKMAQRGLAKSMARHLVAGRNPCRAHHRRRRRSLARGAGALSRPAGGRLHRAVRRRRHRRESRQAGPLRLEFRGRGAALRREVVTQSAMDRQLQSAPG